VWFTDISEEHIASIFRVEEYAKYAIIKKHPPSNISSCQASNLQQACGKQNLFLEVLFDPEDGGNMYL
jgi:hypothetical protein